MNYKAMIRQLFTEADNQTHDLIRYLAALAVLVGLGLSVYSVAVKGDPFSFQDYGTGIGLTFAGVAAALGFKKETPTNGGNS